VSSKRREPSDRRPRPTTLVFLVPLTSISSSLIARSLDGGRVPTNAELIAAAVLSICATVILAAAQVVPDLLAEVRAIRIGEAPYKAQRRTLDIVDRLAKAGIRRVGSQEPGEAVCGLVSELITRIGTLAPPFDTESLATPNSPEAPSSPQAPGYPEEHRPPGVSDDPTRPSLGWPVEHEDEDFRTRRIWRRPVT
jgi:hypothetical protein